MKRLHYSINIIRKQLLNINIVHIPLFQCYRLITYTIPFLWFVHLFSAICSYVHKHDFWYLLVYIYVNSFLCYFLKERAFIKTNWTIDWTPIEMWSGECYKNTMFDIDMFALIRKETLYTQDKKFFECHARRFNYQCYKLRGAVLMTL